jgi:AraC-like DNA-binding protein
MIAKQLIHEMQIKHYFTGPDISLTKLAQNLNISPHQLSETLNQHLQQNFYHFINQ